MTKKTIPANQHYFDQEDIAYITERLASILRGESFLSNYKYVEEFEAAYASAVGVKYAVACNSGTSALELICRGLDLQGKEVILPSNTFVATANAILNAGAKLVFADCGDDMCLSPDDVANRFNANTAAVMHVHIGGLVSEGTLAIQKMCNERGIHFIEDAAQAHGSTLDGVQAGAFGIAAGFSFYSTKVMTTGEGGMAVTNDLPLCKKMKSLREFGKAPTDLYLNVYEAIGYNWRLTEVAALLGIRQLKKLPEFVRRRKEIFNIYCNELGTLSDVQIITPSARSGHNGYKCIFVPKHIDRSDICRGLKKRGVTPSGFVYELPLHKQSIFSEYASANLVKTEYLCSRHFCMPIYYQMTDEDVVYAANILKEVVGEIC